MLLWPAAIESCSPSVLQPLGEWVLLSCTAVLGPSQVMSFPPQQPTAVTATACSFGVHVTGDQSHQRSRAYHHLLLLLLLFLQAGILAADKVLTVSPNYASEIGSGPDKGVELDSIIRMVSKRQIM